ncbi:MAG: hypothetical protein GXP62_07190 [Oligoflexia bacterium]|nr:hypothetical protein [Oligoflexia bacterium]
MTILLALLLLAPAQAGDLQWRATLGAQVDADSHGTADVGVRQGDWSAQLLTDTVDLRWSPSGDRGRAWVAIRAEALATGLFISPWTDGAPDPGRALLSHSLGAQAGALRYLPHGFYAGVQGGLRYQTFGALPATTVTVPGARPISTADGVLGWWSADASLWTRAGADAWLDPEAGGAPKVAPHVYLEATAAAPWAVSPAVELRVGLATQQDDATRTRMGGLNPYVVPLAGAAWAEWRVEDYAALRLGLRGRSALGDHGLLSMMPFADVATAPEISSSQPRGPWAVGLGLVARWTQGRSFVDLAGGVAPWIERASGISPASLYFLVGVDWGSGSRLWRPVE